MALTHFAHLSAQGTAEDFHQLVRRFLPPGTADGPFRSIEGFLVGLTKARTTISLYALPLFLWFATRTFASIRTALTMVYDVPRRPEGRGVVVGFLAGKLRDVMMVGLTVALVVGNAVLTTGLKMVRARAESNGGTGFLGSGFGRTLTEVTAFGFTLGLFYLVYRHASPRRLPRRAALAGSLFTAALFEVAKRLYGWYLHNLAVVSRFSADANIGALILFVLWLYYTALVFLLGAVVAETWDLRSRQHRAEVA